MKLPDSDKLYTFASLSPYSPRQRITIKAADLAFYSLIRSIGNTVKFEVEGIANLESIRSTGRTPIYATWHDRIFLGTYFLRDQGIVFLTSQSFDGEYIARFLQRFGFGVVRGSSTRGGARGLAQMVRELKRGAAMGFTVDGPKGPRYEAKPGPVILAKKTGEPILPFIIEPSGFSTVGSWDKLQIPHPFARARVIFGKPIYVSETAGDEELDRKLRELQASLDDLTEQGIEWRRQF
ncbi:MAG: lysophospholipid acyltransferase family protein [Acidobacteriota bacterium]